MSSVQGWLNKAYKTSKEILPARLQSFRKTMETTYQAASIPVLLGEEQWLLLASCESTSAGYAAAHNVPRHIYAPCLLEWMHYPSGEFRWEEPAPATYGSTTAVQDEFGLCMGPIQRQRSPTKSWHEASTEYSFLVERVIERRWLVTAYPLTTEERETARALRECIVVYYDAAMLPFYQHYGHQFLAWVARASK